MFSTLFAFAQDVKELTPILGEEKNYSSSDLEYWKNTIDLNNQLNSFAATIIYDSLNAEDKKAINSLEMGLGPMPQFGCSWYCGGGPYQISSSGVLNNDEKYSEKNAHDFNMLTAWVPKSKNGIGESISFHFMPKSPRINAIIIHNGYIRTKELWKKNARAKDIKLLANGKAMAILKLEDTTASQRFEFEPLQSSVENEDLVLTLKIMDFYAGEKYTDLVITEINFDGIDVH